MANTKKQAPVIEQDIQTQIGELKTTAAQIRFLHSLGYDRGDISRILGVRYQWVRNVLITPVKKG